jgi:hypothetical protein
MVFQYHPPPCVRIPFQWTPPKKKLLTTSGGVRNTAFPKLKPLFPFFTIFCLFSMCSSEAVSGKMKMDFKNPREVVSHHGLSNKNVSQFFQRCHEKRESKLSFSLFFRIFNLSVTVPILKELLRPAGGEFGETEGYFCPSHTHIQ